MTPPLLQVGGTDMCETSKVFDELTFSIVTRVLTMARNKKSFRMLLIGVAANHVCEDNLVNKMLNFGFVFETIDLIDREMDYQGARLGSLRKAQKAILDICNARRNGGVQPDSRMFKMLLDDSFDPSTAVPEGGTGAPHARPPHARPPHARPPHARPYDLCVYSSGDAQMLTAPNLLISGTGGAPIVADLGLVLHSRDALVEEWPRGARAPEALAFFYFEPFGGDDESRARASWNWPELKSIINRKYDDGLRIGNRRNGQGDRATWLTDSGQDFVWVPSGQLTVEERRDYDQADLRGVPFERQIVAVERQIVAVERQIVATIEAHKARIREACRHEH